MKRRALVLLAVGVLVAACACLPPRAPDGPAALTPARQVVRPTASATPRPSATPSPLPSATATAPASATPSVQPTAFGLVSIPRATVIYYDVTGDTAEALRAQLDALGPVGREGARWDAICNWDYWWSWPVAPDGGCDLAAVKVTYRVQVTFPRWTPPEGAAAGLVARWASFAQSLAEHELGHVDRAVAGVEGIAGAVQGADCSTANAAAETAVARVQEENDAYDEATAHGAGQGARFP